MMLEFDKEKFNENFLWRKKTEFRFAPKKYIIPFDTSNDPVLSLEDCLADFFSSIYEEKPISIKLEELIEAIKKDEICKDAELSQAFQNVVKSIYFTESGKIRPSCLEMYKFSGEEYEIKDEDGRSKTTKNPIIVNIASYLASVLCDRKKLIKLIDKKSQDEHLNVLDSYIINKLKEKKNSLDRENNENESGEEDCYPRVFSGLEEYFEKDFEYVISSKQRTKDYIVRLLELYYFMYTAQVLSLLDDGLRGEADRITNFFFLLNWEKSNQNRPSYEEGWRKLHKAAKMSFVHKNVLLMLNLCKEKGDEDIDYVKIKKLLNEENSENLRKVYEEIGKLINHFERVNNREESDFTVRDDFDWIDKIDNQITSLQLQVEDMLNVESRSGANDRYSKHFIEFCENRFLKFYGRNGMMLTLSEEDLILLTKLAINNEEKLRLGSLFKEFEKRGFYLDKSSQEQVMEYYEKLNLIEKKSDSGEAQYVRQIL